MTQQRPFTARVRGRLGRDLQRLGRRVAGTSSRPPTAPTRPTPPAAARASTPPSPRPDPAGPEQIDRELYTPDPDPVRAAAILDGAFGHGYLVQTGGPARLPGFLDEWPVRQVGPLWLHTAPRTVVTVALPAPPADAGVVVLGHPVDIERGSVDAQQVADRLLRLLVEAGADAMVREAAYLPGRWTLVARSGTTVTVVPDVMASQPVFYAADDSSATLASSEILVALSRGLPPSVRTREVMDRARRLRRSGVVHTPGVLTPVEGVRPLVPNCLLRLDLARPADVRHERFWPWEPRVEDGDVERVSAAFSERMREHVRLLGQLGPLSFSLTGGLDSRVSLAHLGRPAPAGTSAFTYVNPRHVSTSPDVADDLFVANLLASRLGIQHRVLRWREAPAGSVFDRLHRATYPLGRASHGAAHAMWADLPRQLVQVQSIGGEIGTVFGRARTDDPLSAGKAAVQWLGQAGREEAMFTAVFTEYLEHAQLTEDRLLGYNHHDVFYWEHRMGRWSYRKYLDGDFGHRIMLPYNDRALLELMHRLPERERIDKAIYQRILRDRPDLQVQPL